MRLGSLAGSILVAAGLLAPMGDAMAADPPSTIATVTIEGNRPSRTFPLEQPFYVKGVAKEDVTRVDLVFVRYWSRPFGIRPPKRAKEGSIRSCEDVARYAKAEALVDLAKKGPGTFQFRDVWNVDSNVDLEQLEREQRVLLVPPWTAAPDAKGSDQFEILVDQTEWFLPGAHYCAFIYEYGRNAQVDSKIAAAVQKYATTIDEVTVPGKDLGGDVGPAIAKFLEGTFCVQGGSAGAAPCKKDDRRVPVESDKKWGEIAEAFKDRGQNAAFTMARRRRELLELSRCWNDRTQTGLPLGSLLATDPKGQLALELAALAGYVSRATKIEEVGGAGATKKAKAAAVTRTVYRTNDGAFEIGEVEPLQNPKTGRLKDLRVYSADRSKQQVVGVSLDQLVVRGSATTLEDVFLFLEGATVSKDRAKGIAELLAELGSTSKARPSDLSSLSPVLGTLKTLLEDADGSLPATDPRVLVASLKPANPSIPWGADYVSDVCGKQLIPSKDQEPSKALDEYLGDLIDDYGTVSSQWAAFERDAAKSLNVTNQEVVPIVQEGYTQERYISDYVTPVQGFAGVVADDGNAPFFLSYAGIQIYFAANPVNQPMWSRRYRDFARFASLELGIAERAQPMGPQNRFRGFSGGHFPPVMFGVGLQVAPWLTLSNGVTVLERRRSEFAGERYDVVARYFFAGTVQLNVPGIIRRLSRSQRGTDDSP